MKNIFYSKKFIPFRNFDQILSSFKFRIFYYNNFLRKILSYILKLLIILNFKNILSRRIGHYFYFCQAAKEVGTCKYSNEKLSAVKLGDNYRKIILANTEKKISIILDKVESSKLFFGISVLENQYFLNEKFMNYDLNTEIILKGIKKNEKFNLQIPLRKKKHGIFSNITNGKFYDFYVSLNSFQNEKLEIELNFSFNKNSFLALEKSSFSEEKQIYRTIAVSSPFLNIKNKTKKVFLLSIESLTNFVRLEKILSSEIKIPFLKKIADKYKYSNNAYSATDWTMPNLYSLHTGLTPFQHGVCDPRAPSFKENVNDKILMLSEIFKKKNFLNTAFVSGKRFDVSKNWVRGYDNIYKSITPFEENAPSFDRLKKYILDYKDVNLFTYMHFDILHSPFLHLKNSDALACQDVKPISAAITQRNFYPLYIQQLEKLDKEIKNFFEFLNNNKLYDESMVIIYGDHGPSLPPKWEKYSGNSLYDEHLNVPLIVKEPDWLENKLNLEFDKFYTSQIKIYNIILESLNETKPEYFDLIPQHNPKFNNYAFSEMLHMPNHDCYHFRLSSKNSHILAKTKIDWATKKLRYFTNEDELKKDNKFDICNDYLQQNLLFKEKYKNNNFLDKKIF
jgi:hypothetical protein